MESRLPKQERISSRSDIECLFKNGEAFLAYPVKCTYLERTEGNNKGGHSSGDYSRVMVMAPKRNLKRAVDRNLIKRRLREAYRLNKGLLSGDPKEEGHKHYDIALSYIAKGGILLDYDTIETAVRKILQRLWEQQKQ